MRAVCRVCKTSLLPGVPDAYRLPALGEGDHGIDVTCAKSRIGIADKQEFGSSCNACLHGNGLVCPVGLLHLPYAGYTTGDVRIERSVGEDAVAVG